jgi:proline dehydrogenase
LLNDLLERILAGRWIAGPEIEDAIGRARVLNKSGIGTIINYLGEQETQRRDIADTMKVYEELIREISHTKINADITVKATQLGMSVNEGLARTNYRKLAVLCKKNKIFLWLDMEEYELVDKTMSLYLSAGRISGRGICIQSYLRRSAKDLMALTRKKAIVRLVKGAYTTATVPIYENRRETTENYERLMDYLFENFGAFTIATHDTNIIEKALKLNKTYKRDVTYAMLNGIRDRYAERLAKHNKISIYVPFGRQWVSYSYRRMKEFSNLELILTSVVRRDA